MPPRLDELAQKFDLRLSFGEDVGDARRVSTRRASRAWGVVPALAILAAFPLWISAFVAGFGLNTLSPDFHALELGAWVGLTLLMIGFAYAALLMFEREKRIVLYLRRFGLTEANRAIEQVVEAGLGRTCRVATLDDSKFPVLEVPRLERRLTRYVLPSMVLLAALLMFAVFMSVIGDLEQEDGILLLEVITVLSFWTLFAPFIFFLVHRSRVRRRARVRVDAASDLRALEIRLRILRSRLLSPSFLAAQACVVTVTDALWQDAVQRCEAIVDGVLIDVSEPTTNLLWEVELLASRGLAKCVFVAEERLLHAWLEGVEMDPGSVRATVAGLLREQPILLYAGKDPGRTKRFRTALRRRFENIPPFDGPKVQIEMRERFALVANALGFYAIAFIGSVIAAGVVAIGLALLLVFIAVKRAGY